MAEKIRVSIQEIVYDFERLIRYDERLYSSFNNKMFSDEDIEMVHKGLEELIAKYLPDYREKVPSKYFSEDTSTYEKASILYEPLYENFKQILYQLI